MRLGVSFVIIFFAVQYTADQAFGQVKVNWMTFDEAIVKNNAKPKKIFIDMYTDWCGWCKKLDESTFSNPTIAEYLNNNFYPVKFNAETKQEISYKGKVYKNNSTSAKPPHDLAIALTNGNLSYPTSIYLDEKSNLLTVVPGYLTPNDLEPILVFFAEDHYKTKKWDEFKKNFVSKIK